MNVEALEMILQRLRGEHDATLGSISARESAELKYDAWRVSGWIEDLKAGRTPIMWPAGV